MPCLAPQQQELFPEIACGATALALPSFLEDETLFGWTSRVHLRRGGGSAAFTSRLLFRHPYAGVFHDFPGNLAVLSASACGLLGDAWQIACSSTLLPYYLPLVKESNVANPTFPRF